MARQRQRMVTAGILAASILGGSYAFATPHQTPIANLAPSTDPCIATQEEITWLREDIYPRLAKDIPRILEQGWAYKVNEKDLYHVHVYVEGEYTRSPVAERRGKLKERIAFLYHSKEDLNIHEQRNIFIGSHRFEAYDDIYRTATHEGAFDSETGEMVDARFARYHAHPVPGIELVQVGFSTSREGLLDILKTNSDASTFANSGAYWFGIEKRKGEPCDTQAKGVR